MSRLTKTSLMLAIFFALDKGLGILRQVVIARQFGLSAELDAYNAANNIPDLLFALISGGSLAIAFIPVLSEVLTQHGRESAWRLFSRIANLAFMVTGVLALAVALLARPMVGWELGIAPGFNESQQELVITLMRLNLIATLLFSISGLVMAGLQANQHFFLPAMAPLLYNLGQIFGALILVPQKNYVLGSVTFPALGLGVYGLVYGVILGAVLHLVIQVPGLIIYRFRWIPEIGLRTPSVQKVLRLMGPRLVTMLIIQLIFIVRDNLASRLPSGAVTALAYGWMIQQVPETLLGTALGTAILPTLSEQVAIRDWGRFQETVENAVKVILSLTIPVCCILAVGLRPLLVFAFGFEPQGTDLLLWVTRGFLLGLTGHALLEVAARSFYAQQDAITPLFAALVNITIYIVVGSRLFRPVGAAGISLTDALAFTSQAAFLLFLLRFFPNIKTKIWRKLKEHFLCISSDCQQMRFKGLSEQVPGIQLKLGNTIYRALLGAGLGGLMTFAVLMGIGDNLWGSIVGMLLGGCLALLFILPELRIMLKL